MEKLNSQLEFTSYNQVQEFQDLKLQETLKYLSEHSKFYKRMFADNNIDITTIKTVQDLVKIPTSTKNDLQQFNDDFICVDKSQIIDYVTSSGTSGDPVTFALSEIDLQRLAYNEAHSFSVAGINSGDTIQLMTTIDKRFMAGLAYFLGARELKCGVVRVGNGIPVLQWETINRIKPNVCIVVPSFLIKLAQFAIANNIDHNNCSLKKAICIGESLTDENGNDTVLAKKIKQLWPNLQLHSTYASTEMQASFTQCNCFAGLHQPMELIITELLDDNDQPVAEGQLGELVITTLGVQAMPLLRFKTGDMLYKLPQTKCECGRCGDMFSSVIGRKGQMVKFKGTTLYPPALYNVLDNIPEIKSYIVVVGTNNIGTDNISVKLNSTNWSDSFVKQVKDLFRAKVRVAPDIIFISEQEMQALQMPQMSRKLIKFIDER